jgi:hypothetical protein
MPAGSPLGMSAGVPGFAAGELGSMFGVVLVGFVFEPFEDVDGDDEVELAAPAAPELPVVLDDVVGFEALGVFEVSLGAFPSSDPAHAAAHVARIMEAQIFAFSFMCSSVWSGSQPSRYARKPTYGHQSKKRAIWRNAMQEKLATYLPVPANSTADEQSGSFSQQSGRRIGQYTGARCTWSCSC